MANQTGSKPKAIKDGPTIGTITNTIWKKSKKNPNKKITTITINKEVIAPPGIFVIKFSTIRSPPKPLKTSENKDAPIRIKKTIDEIFNVSSQADITDFNSIFFLMDKIMEPKAPNHADSVGVAIPNKIDPKTTIIKLKGGNMVIKVSVKLNEDFFKFLSIGNKLGL